MRHCTCYRADCYRCYPVNDLLFPDQAERSTEPRYLSPIFTCVYCDRDFGSSADGDAHMPCDVVVWHLQHHTRWNMGCRMCDEEFPTTLCGPGMCACGGCDGACENAYPELRRNNTMAWIATRPHKTVARKGLIFNSRKWRPTTRRYASGNYIQRTYSLRRRYGFPFSCLTFRDRYR